MGQQQLLLLVLSAIIVGVSIVIGINMFSQSAGQANQDAVLQDIMTIASRAQQWYRKPALLGGGDRSFAGTTLDTLNFPAQNANGQYSITAAAGQITIQGIGTEDQNGDGTPVTIEVVVVPDSTRPPTFINR